VDKKEATAIVVQMAKDREENSSEGQALRLILREIKELWAMGHTASTMIDSMTEALDAATR